METIPEEVVTSEVTTGGENQDRNEYRKVKIKMCKAYSQAKEGMSPEPSASPTGSLIIVESPEPQLSPLNKKFYEPQQSSILENILLRNREERRNSATPPPSSPTEMAYSYKKSQR